MGTNMGKLVRWVLVLVLLAGGYYWLVLDSRMPEDASYAFDINEVRKLADSVPGAKPMQRCVMSTCIRHGLPGA
jgi:hypothetical protein